MTKSYVRTATCSTLKVEANLTQILNFKANFHTEFEPFFKKKIMLTMVDTLTLVVRLPGVPESPRRTRRRLPGVPGSKKKKKKKKFFFFQNV